MAIDFMVSSSVGKRNAQEGTKTHGMQLHSRDIVVTHYLAQHRFGLISFTLAGEKVPSRAGFVPACFIKASWASMARLSSARCWEALGIHCHC